METKEDRAEKMRELRANITDIEKNIEEMKQKKCALKPIFNRYCETLLSLQQAKQTYDEMKEKLLARMTHFDDFTARKSKKPSMESFFNSGSSVGQPGLSSTPNKHENSMEVLPNDSGQTAKSTSNSDGDADTERSNNKTRRKILIAKRRQKN